MQYLIVIEDALTDFLPGRQKAQFNLEAILRPDTMTRYESYKLAREAGWMTVDEIRAKEDMPPLGETAVTEIVEVVDPNLEEGETNV
jgi:phage portal protein BeeE